MADVDSSTPAGRQRQLGRLIARKNSLSDWDVATKRHLRDAVREAARLEAQNPAPPASLRATPEGRAQQLAAIEADRVRAERRNADLAHQPGSASTDCFQRVGHWERRVDETETWWAAAHSRWCDASAAAGEYPAPDAAAAVRLAAAERLRLADEAARFRQLRDQCLAECDDLRAWVREG